MSVERALELANRLHGCEQATIPMAACQELEAILRHYARIAPHYAEIMQADVVGYHISCAKWPTCLKHTIGLDAAMREAVSLQHESRSATEISELIIKPKPIP